MTNLKKIHYRVVCAVITNDGRALAVQRSKKMKMPLLWEFPGGKVHDGESDESALIREIHEELGCTIRIISPMTAVYHEYLKFSIDLIPFHAEMLSSSVVLSEHVDLHWCTARELRGLEWCEADIGISEEAAALLQYV